MKPWNAWSSLYLDIFPHTDAKTWFHHSGCLSTALVIHTVNMKNWWLKGIRCNSHKHTLFFVSTTFSTTNHSWHPKRLSSSSHQDVLTCCSLHFIHSLHRYLCSSPWTPSAWLDSLSWFLWRQGQKHVWNPPRHSVPKYTPEELRKTEKELSVTKIHEDKRYALIPRRFNMMKSLCLYFSRIVL